MSGEEELGALGGADGALGGGVHSPDAEGLGPEGGEVWVSKLGVSFVAGVLPGLAGVSAEMMQRAMGASAVGTGLCA